MRERLLESFIAAVQEGSFTAAAKRLLSLSPLSPSKLPKLEKEVGFKLFYRANSAVRLTEAGQEFYDGAGGSLIFMTRRCPDAGGLRVFRKMAPVRPLQIVHRRQHAQPADLQGIP
jgi:hypothetical protein